MLVPQIIENRVFSFMLTRDLWILIQLTARVIFSLVLTRRCQLYRVYFSTILKHFFASKHFCLGNTRSAFPYQQQCVNTENSLENCAVSRERF